MWFRSRRFEDFREEIQSHIALETDRLIREGMNPDDARAATVRAFGNVLTAQERFYESRRVRWLDHIRQDVQYAFRMFRYNPGFTAIAVISLALGIGANSAIFSLMDQIMFRKLPVTRPDELVLVKSPGPMPGRSTADDSGGSS